VIFSGPNKAAFLNFKYADIVEDRILLEQSKNDAWQLIRSDANLSKPEHEQLKGVFNPYFKKRAGYFGAG
jgi:ATP-dependent DNA helicase RecG